MGAGADQGGCECESRDAFLPASNEGYLNYRKFLSGFCAATAFSAGRERR